MTQELYHLTIAEAADLIRSRKLSPVELTDAVLEHIDAVDGALNSYIVVTSDAARAEARRAEDEIAQGHWRGPLHGIPIGLKDIYGTAGVTTTAHSALLRDNVPLEDAATVSRLKNAGAVILGKLSTYEFALGGSSFDLPWPPARNPWNLALDPSGSSSGSGAAVAAGLCLGAMGSDTGGSIRGPASWCGIAGLKPTYGLLSRRGILPLSFSLDHAGPMCWTAQDCAFMMDALAAYDPFDAASAQPGPIDFAGSIGVSLAGLRIGVVRHFFEEEVETDPEVIASLEAALTALREAGASVGEAHLAPFAEYNAIGMLISRAEAFAIHEHSLRNTPEKYGAYGRRRLMAGAFVSGSDYVNAMRHRSRLISAYADVMESFDILIFPTGSGTAKELGADSMAAPLAKTPFFNRVFNVLGGPALSICSGFSSAGLPIGLQLAGRPFEDALVLRVGDRLERVLATRGQRPKLSAAAVSTETSPSPISPVPSDDFSTRMKAMGLPVLADAEMAALESMADGILSSALFLRGPRPYSEEPSNTLRLVAPIYGKPPGG